MLNALSNLFFDHPLFKSFPPKFIGKKNYGSGAVAGKKLLVTNACWIRDCWDVPGSSNGVCEGNIARSGYKTAYKKIFTF